MKTRILLLATLLAVSTFGVFAQRVVALHSATSGVHMYSGINPFVDAYNAAQSGDTIYLPGGSFATPTTINKQLYIYGVGYHPDSTAVTLPTQINGNIYPGENADGLVVEGVIFTSATTNASNISCSNMTFKRCRFNDYVGISGGSSNMSTGNAFLECLFMSYLTIPNTSGWFFTNCIFQNNLSSMSSSTIKNCIFLFNTGSWSNPVLNGSVNNELSNNIFLLSSSSYLTYNSSGNIFNNNVFVYNSPDYGTAAITRANYTGVTPANIFVSQSGNSFDYTHDYHLKSPAVYVGNDASQVGIYGGMYPYKTGAVPSTPHIQLKNIGTKTNSSGQLSVQIKVQAQNN